MIFFCIDDQQSVAVAMVAAGMHDLIRRLCRNGRCPTTLLAIHLTYQTQTLGIDVFLQLLIFCAIEIHRTIHDGI